MPESADRKERAVSPIDKRLLFDSTDFLQPLKSKKSSLQIFKRILADGTLILNRAFDDGHDISNLLHQRTWLIDQLLKHVWQFIVQCEDIALIAVGGYGRRELHPASDIDLMILKKSRIPKSADEQIERFLLFLWDAGLKIGYSVRTIKDCVSESRADITVLTNIMESRLLAGPETLFQSMRQSTGPKKIWSAKKFFKSKWQEQIERHKKYSNTEYNLEPDIKEGLGSLRDIQTILWVAKRHFCAEDLYDLVRYKFLTEQEYYKLYESQRLLWRIRYVLHVLTERCDDRLLFDYQRHVAESFGFYASDNSNIERFMKIYYQTAREISCLNEMLLQHFQEAIIYRGHRQKIKAVNKRFQIYNNFIEVCNNKVFKNYPFTLLEIFLIKQQTLSIKGIRASTIRLIREHLYLIDNKFRDDIRNQSLFIEIIRQPRYVGHELRRMHRYGILGKYLPAFGDIEGQMQFDLFHAYSVDEHILRVIQNTRLFGLAEYADIYPLCHEILHGLPKRELLYLAALFHDIAKGRKGDHSKLGVQDAVDFCRRHGFSDYDTGMVGWLVEHHLLLSKTAQREDISDPGVINSFAIKIGDKEHLDYLYLLTVADVSGTNPELWNSWKDSLFKELYNETAHAFQRGLGKPFNRKECAETTREAAKDLIDQKLYTDTDFIKLWNSLDDDYFLRYSADEIAWHTRSIMVNKGEQMPLVKMRQKTNRGGTEVFLYMKDQDDIFSTTTAVLEQLSLTVVDARIITSNHGFTLDTYIILNKSGKSIAEASYRKEIVEKLYVALANIKQYYKRTPRRQSRKQRNFPIKTKIYFTRDEVNQRTVMEVITADKIGLLSSIGLALSKYNLRLHGAKIATYGTRAEDIFFITDKSGGTVAPAILADLENYLVALIC